MKQTGIAIVGAGNIGALHAQSIEVIPQAQVAVVCDVDEARGRALAESCGAVWEEDLQQVLTRDDVQVVSVCTPSGSHAEIAVEAAQARKHLIVEKPIDVTLERADRIIHAAERAGVKITCILPYRFMKGVQVVKEACERGRLGRLTLADVYVKWYRSQEYYDGNWRGTWALDGGGALMNQSIHNIDLLQWLAGPVDTIFGHAATLARRIETEDTASAVLMFKSGALGVIQGATSCWPGDRARLELHGDQGTIALEEGCIVRWQLADASDEEEQRMLTLEESLGSGSRDPTAISYEMHRRQITDMVAAIREDREPAVMGGEARKAIEIILGIYRSSQTGSLVRLPLN